MNTNTTKVSKTLYLTLIIIVYLASAPLFPAPGKKTAKGIVFDDVNQNGVFDKGEKGVPNTAVSNQYDVVLTDKNGHFRLPVGKETVIFVSKPAGYDLPLHENNLPRFYYIHQPAGSPPGLKYKGIEPTGKLPASIDFPLVKGKTQEMFNVIVVADPQTRTPGEVTFYRDDVVTRMMSINAGFYLALGDVMYNDLSLFDKMIRVVGQMGIPVYHVIGNHDMNFRVPDHIHEAETFKRLHGPDYYSFNYGNVHFVVLNSIKYKGWNKKENKSGGYTGYFHERQLTWLKNDLSVVPGDHLVVLCMHIPVVSMIYLEDSSKIVNRESFFKILENRDHLLALAGHMHFVEYLEFTKKDGWKGKADFPSLTAGAGCGTWWHGPRDARGIPFGMSTDGTPNGYFLFSFNGSRFNYRFCPAGPSLHSQMRINSPVGTLSSQDVNDCRVHVNVFAGTPGTTVTYRLDGGTEVAMERKLEKDPFFTKLVEENKDKYKDWMEPSLCSHIWVAPLTGDLKPGIHRLEVTVKDLQGNVFTAYRLFEVAPL
jgi:3',5'-cyclic AMP phosphodiesterase CpdA